MSGLRPSGLHINKPAVFGLIGAFLVIVLFYKFYFAAEPISFHTSGLQSLLGGGSDGQDTKLVMKGGISVDGKSGGGLRWNLTQLLPPPSLDQEAKEKLMRKSEMFDVEISGKKIPTYIQQVINGKTEASGDILFLHGAKFSSNDWQNIGALDQVANWGFRAIAIDLPGKGKSTQALLTSQVTEFLPALIAGLEMKRPIIIAPSMSGQYALPYLFTEPEKSTEKATAFVPVAPVGTSTFASSFPKRQLPTLIVYGSKDSAGPRTFQDLRALPNSIEAQIPDAGHACYLDQREAFFKYLYAFLKQLKKPTS